MITILQTKNETLVPIEQFADGAWMNVINPDERDIERLLSLLLEDVIIENQQALEMTGIAGNLLGQMMDAYASIIQNNQNIIFKIMTAWAIILSLPAIISGFFGMNVGLPFESHPNAFMITTGILLAIMLVVMFSFGRSIGYENGSVRRGKKMSRSILTNSIQSKRILGRREMERCSI
ncbi:MAG TPA: CorA family divalent cation transporter [Anaerolineaceae bacterium]|jgi:hypothetical protein|nr:CorA family divalent cation transporter [Anaerolineaceae bacterium]